VSQCPAEAWKGVLASPPSWRNQRRHELADLSISSLRSCSKQILCGQHRQCHQFQAERVRFLGAFDDPCATVESTWFRRSSYDHRQFVEMQSEVSAWRRDLHVYPERMTCIRRRSWPKSVPLLVTRPSRALSFAKKKAPGGRVIARAPTWTRYHPEAARFPSLAQGAHVGHVLVAGGASAAELGGSVSDARKETHGFPGTRHLEALSTLVDERLCGASKGTPAVGWHHPDGAIARLTIRRSM
jgi:hypothetical protein